MATHSSPLAWRTPWTEEPGGLQSMGSHRVGHNRSDLACTRHVCREACPPPHYPNPRPEARSLAASPGDSQWAVPLLPRARIWATFRKCI